MFIYRPLFGYSTCILKCLYFRIRAPLSDFLDLGASRVIQRPERAHKSNKREIPNFGHWVGAGLVEPAFRLASKIAPYCSGSSVARNAALKRRSTRTRQTTPILEVQWSAVQYGLEDYPLISNSARHPLAIEIFEQRDGVFPRHPEEDRKSTRLNSSHLGISY